MRALASLLTVTALIATLGCKDRSPSKPGPAAPTPTAPTPPPAPTPAPAPAAAPTLGAPISKPFLFEATKGDAKVYLLGTIHLGVDAEKQLPPWVLATLDAQPAFAMETDLSDPSVMTLLIRSDGGALSKELGPEDWELLRTAIGPSLADGMDRLKPFAAFSALAVKDLPMTAPMDMTLHQRAKAAGKRLVYLETVADQLTAIEPFATAADIRALLHNGEVARTQSLKMVADYTAGDAAALKAMFDDRTLWVAAGRDPARFGEMLEATLGRRNRAWIAPITELATHGGGFVAVGAGHLVGPDNVPDLLAAAGWQVRRLDAAP